MPLPDAIKRSPRVYTLLQNQDLENVTADTLADVADPISIEEQNEDELRRICLIAFARMVTKGSFDGWLSSGGGALHAGGCLGYLENQYIGKQLGQHRMGATSPRPPRPELT